MEQHPRGFWEHERGESHPPRGSLPSIPFLSKLSVSHLWDQPFRWEERRAGSKQSSAVLCLHWKVHVQPWVTSTRCRTEHQAVNKLPGLGTLWQQRHLNGKCFLGWAMILPAQPCMATALCLSQLDLPQSGNQLGILQSYSYVSWSIKFGFKSPEFDNENTSAEYLQIFRFSLCV